MFPKHRFTLRVSLFTLIGALLVCVVAVMAWYNYEKSSETAVQVADDLLLEVNDKVRLEIDSLFSPVLALADRVSELPHLAHKPTLLSHPALSYFIKVLESSPAIYSLYIGYDDGDFYQVLQRNPKRAGRKGQWGAPEDTRFAIRRIMRAPDGRRVDIWKFLDADHRLLGSRASPATEYDPRVRPWYMQARNSGRVIKTPPYLYTSIRSMGLTVARRFDGDPPGVFGVDITLDAICDFLSKQRVSNSGIVFLFDSTGHLIAHPSSKYSLPLVQVAKGADAMAPLLSQLDAPMMEAVYQQFCERRLRPGRFDVEVNGAAHIARISNISSKYLNNGYVAVIAPRSDFTRSVIETRNKSLTFTLLMLLFFAPIIFYVSERVSISLQDLAEDSEEIRRFKLDKPQQVQSVIKEIDELAVSMRTMKSALRIFGQYMPKSLVAQIVRAGEEPRLGGKRQPLTLLFSDVANFTAISERIPPENLMLKTSEYFQMLGECMLKHGATIDKFIGDAVMAFWNAPEQRDDHVRRACAAALDCARTSNELNARWEDEGETPFLTRFGLHTGECIVGNVGASDRMNYTAMGRRVNIASRLEGLNKQLHTQILASAEVRDQAGDGFLFRSAGRVVPKGSASPVTVFELVGSLPGHDLPCPVSREDRDYFTRWELAYDHYINCRLPQAIALFEELSELRPGDMLLRRLLDRAGEGLEKGQADNWDCVEHFTRK